MIVYLSNIFFTYFIYFIYNSLFTFYNSYIRLTLIKDVTPINYRIQLIKLYFCSKNTYLTLLQTTLAVLFSSLFLLLINDKELESFLFHKGFLYYALAMNVFVCFIAMPLLIFFVPNKKSH